MYRDYKVGAVIVAAGKGKRMGREINKVFLDINDKPILVHTLEAFEKSGLVDKIIVVVSEDEFKYFHENIIDKYNFTKISGLAKGGRERQESMINGLNALKGFCDIVVTHDGARPLVTPHIIDHSIQEAVKHGAAACAVPVKDTIKIADTEAFVSGTPDRSTLYAVQTPQTFMFDKLYNAHMAAKEEGFTGTDDTVLVERTGGRIKLFPGSYENLKITTPEDMLLAEAILKNRHSQ